MKKTFTCLLAILFVLPLFSQEPAISYRLEKAMEETPEATHHIGVQLSDRVDIYSMAQEFDRNRTSIKERSEKVIAALKAKATATQGDVINYLKNQPGVDIESVQGYWINNMIFAKVSTEVVEDLKTNPAIEKIDLNGKLELVEYESADESCEEMMLSPDGVEPGLLAIKADEMWKMGYTGRGRLALGADTGIDPNHPAISNQYRGIYMDETTTWFDDGNNGTTSPFDCDNHGTHTIGTVLGIDRLNKDTIGVAPNATWIGAKIICGDDSGTQDNISSFQWAINPDGDPSTISDIPDAINNSWRDPQVGDNDCNSVYVDVLQALEAVGVAVIFSAGNSGPGDGTITPPHNINYDLVNLFSVGALDAATTRLTIANFSSRGPSHCVPPMADSLTMISLAIKPEVSAPGVSVRSSVRGGEYSRFSGTSMASPHVAGAILLLREAFPDLTGRDLKFALYNTARDLGAPGEDNVYGTGIIDVKAAFDYLVAEGNTPADPRMANDALLISVDGPASYCGNFIYPEILVENLGSTSMTSLEIHMEFPDIPTTEVYTWTGNMEPGERMTIIPDEITLASGTYDMIVELKKPNGMVDEHVLNNRFSTQVVVTDRATIEAYAADNPDGTVCEGTRALLRNEFELTTPGRITYEWYDQPAGGRLLGTGQAYLTEPLTQNTTFYADILVEYDKVGATDNTIGATFGSPFVRGGIDFDASFPFLLKTIKVYPLQSGFINIVLKAPDGNVLQQRDFFLNEAGGEKVIQLNYDVPQGQGMKLEIQQGDDDSRQYVALNYNRNGGEFPYVIEDVLTLNKSTVGTPTSGQYWYFYDWKIEHREVCGRTPVRVEVDPAGNGPTAAFSVSQPTVDINNNQSIDFTDQSTGATSWNWNFGDGTTSADQNTSHTYTKVGEYIVSLTTTSDAGCTGSAIETIMVTDASSSTEDLIEIQGVKVFPNPTSGQLSIELDFDKKENVAVQLTDLLGTPLRNIPETSLVKGILHMNIADLSSGIYLLVLKTEEGRAVRKILKL